MPGMPDLIIYLFAQSNQYYWHVTKKKGKYKEISYEIKAKLRIMSALPSLISPRIPNFFSSPSCLSLLQINRKLGFLGGYSIKIRTNKQKYKAQKMKSKSAQVLFLKTKKRYLVLCSTYVIFLVRGGTPGSAQEIPPRGALDRSYCQGCSCMQSKPFTSALSLQPSPTAF